MRKKVNNLAISEEEKELLATIKTQKDYLLYILLLLKEKKIDLSVDKVFITGKTKEKYFKIPTVIERFYLQTLDNYIRLTDLYYYKFKLNNKSIVKEKINDISKLKYTSIPKTIKKRISKYTNANYASIYYLFYYVKLKYNIKITDGFLYMLYNLSDIPPAILIYAKLHSPSQINRLKKKNWDWKVIFMGNKNFRESVEKLEKILGS